jgi:5-methyltetrahydrofolate--homocysteine methyltransferase
MIVLKGERMRKIIDEIKSGRILVCDGAWGTELFKRGLKPGNCPELWNISNPDKVYEIAESYVNAGADIIETNSFGGSSISLARYGLSDRAYELNCVATQISRKAAGDDIHVAGSIGPSGKLILMGDITKEELYESFAGQAKALEDGGADAAIIETMIDVEESSIAVKAVRENTNLEIMALATYCRTQSGEFRTMMGASVNEMVSRAIENGAGIIGTNCGSGIDMMVEIVREIQGLFPDMPIIVQPNAGLPEVRNGILIYPESPEYMASRIPTLIKAGANIIGGCCGTSSQHIKLFAKVIGQLQTGMNLHS